MQALGRPTDVYWGVIFPGERAQQCEGVSLCARHPQLYEAGLEYFTFLILIHFATGKFKYGVS